MDISIFDVLGPVMIGPSSSHTAGAARLGRCASLIVGRPFTSVRFGLCGSFAKTGLGHGTHSALLAGTLGLEADDERLPRATEIARERHIGYEFYNTERDDAHENTAVIGFTFDDGTTQEIVGCSVGGGRICITEINSMATEIRAETPTIIITQYDRPGVVCAVSGVLAEAGINIGVMRVTRNARGETASCVIETDLPPDVGMADRLRALPNVCDVRIINL